MLQDIRHNLQGTAAKVIIGLIVVTFAAFGIESILVGGGGGGVAEVNGEEISPQELQQSVLTQQRRLINSMGENFDPAMIEEDRLRAQALEVLINRKLLSQSARDMDLTISEPTLGSVIGGMPEFQVDGAFSPELYKQILSDNGYSPAFFKRSLRNDMMLAQVRTGLAASEFATPAEVDAIATVAAEQRDFRYLTIPRERVATQEEITEADIEAYYRERESAFLTEESVDLAFIHLTLDDFREPVEEAEIVEAFETARRNFEATVESRVSHILIAADADNADERLADAEARLARGEAFAEVASDLSDDIGSAGRGGDLGYTSGEAFPEAMEQAIAELEPGQVSEPVRTEAGTHLLLVTERQAQPEPSLEDMREQLQESLQRDEAQRELVLTVENLRDLSFNANNLREPAGELGLELEHVDGVTRSQSEGLFSNPVLRDAAFSPEVLNDGHNSEVIELSGEEFVVLRVQEHRLPQVKPLAEVRESIVAAIREERTRSALVEQAGSILAELRGGAAMDQLAARLGYQWQVELGAGRQISTVAPELARRVFELPPGSPSNASDFVLTGAGDAVVFELIRVVPGELDALPAGEQEGLQQQIAGEYANLVDAEYRARLRRSAEINVM